MTMTGPRPLQEINLIWISLSFPHLLLLERQASAECELCHSSLHRQTIRREVDSNPLSIFLSISSISAAPALTPQLSLFPITFYFAV